MRELVFAGRARGHAVEEVTTKNFAPHERLRLAILGNLQTFRLWQVPALLGARFVYFSQDTNVVPAIQQSLFDGARAVFFCSPLHRDYFAQKFQVDPSKITLIPTLFDPEKFAPSAKEPVTVHLGRLSAPKGIDSVLQHAARNPDREYRIYGPRESGLELQLPANVTVHDAVPRDEVARILARALAYIHLPRWTEAFGRTVIEAALSGCSLIVNRNVGACSYDWDLSDREALVRELTLGPTRFWEKVEQALGS